VNESAEIVVPGKGRIVVSGSPVSQPIPGASAAAFACEGAAAAAALTRALPPGGRRPDILVTHGPAYGVNDKTFFGRHVGSLDISRHLVQLAKQGRAPLFHLHGHIHEARGVTRGVDAKQLLGTASERHNGAELRLPTTLVNCASVNLLHQRRPRVSPTDAGFAVAFDVPVALLQQQ
jgi:hypothetical protein